MDSAAGCRQSAATDYLRKQFQSGVFSKYIDASFPLSLVTVLDCSGPSEPSMKTYWGRSRPWYIQQRFGIDEESEPLHKLQPIESNVSFRIMFIECLSYDIFRTVTDSCELNQEALSEALRRANLPTDLLSCPLNAWGFTEIPTIWRIPSSDSYKIRRLGFLFSNQICLVVAQRIERGDLVKFRYPVKGFIDLHYPEKGWKECSLSDMIKELIPSCSKQDFLDWFSKLVILGWHEYLVEIRRDMSLATDDDAEIWLNYRYCCRMGHHEMNLKVNKRKFIQLLELDKNCALQGKNVPVQDFEEWKKEIKQLTEIMEEVEWQVKETISKLLSLREQKLSVRQNFTVEYFSYVAALFLPLTVFVSLFGMNIGGMTADNPSWRWFAAASVSGTVISCILLVLGRRIWLYYKSTPKAAKREWLWLSDQTGGRLRVRKQDSPA